MAGLQPIFCSATLLAGLCMAAPASEHWAFKPVQQPPLPKTKTTGWAQTPIDLFILQKLEDKGFAPSAATDKRTLIRRASYDLTGLPPAPEQVDAFVRDSSTSAFEAVVDRLLSSPHYGERWARHWLDVARYSDTKGYVYDREEKRFVHSHVYRDWVVRALNEDMPYDRFIKMQIAADQICGASNQWDLAALGFLTVGRRFLGVMHDIIDDRIDVLMRGTQGLTVSCARCHDHKFDPIPTRDYYSLYGVFYNTAEKTVPVGGGARNDASHESYVKGLREREEKLEKGFQEMRAKKTDRLRAQAAQYLVAVLDAKQLPSEEFYTIMDDNDLNPVIVRQWEAYIHNCRESFHPVFGPWHEFARLKNFGDGGAAAVIDKILSPSLKVNARIAAALTNEPPKSMRDVAERYGRVFAHVDKAWREHKKANAENPGPLDPAQEEIREILHGPASPATVPDGAVVDLEWFFDEGGRVELAKLQAEIDRSLLKASAALPHAVILADRASPRNARVLLRGNPANKGEEVPRQFLELIAGPNRKPFEHGSGRLELAEAIAHASNPLTARVMVNRVWMHHFGAGLVGTPSDFGTRCEPPSHPELLDWLASSFVQSGWSLKKLHKLIMLSAVYQQTSDPQGHPAGEVDARNRLLWRMNRQRLDFESMRDSLLAVAGELDERVGGKAVEMFDTIGVKRRALYGYIDRQFVPGVLRMFDVANPDLHAPQRPETTVPQQALYFMNSPFVAERARTLARQLEAESIPVQRVEKLYRAAYQRAPTPRQLELALNFVKIAEAAPKPAVPKPLPVVWQYGYGKYDDTAGRVRDFVALPHFTGEAWQGGLALPDEKLGWAQLTAEGGHPGNDLEHAVVRRWIAPSNMTVNISGTIRHEPKAGDGIGARVVSSRGGTLGTWKVHASKTEVKVEGAQLQAGDTLDFVVDIGGNLNSDQFKWAPAITLTSNTGEAEWNAKRDFSGPSPSPPVPLTAWEKYTQVVLLSNEFMFVD